MVYAYNLDEMCYFLVYGLEYERKYIPHIHFVCMVYIHGCLICIFGVVSIDHIFDFFMFGNMDILDVCPGLGSECLTYTAQICVVHTRSKCTPYFGYAKYILNRQSL